MERKLIGYCGVDSGQILLTDPCYVSDFLSDEEFAPSEGETHPYSYNGACGASLSEQGGGQLLYKHGGTGAGVCVSSGWGDGLYPVFVEYAEDGRVSSVTVQFISDDEDEFEDDSEDENELWSDDEDEE
jgi:hypothetical protein